MKVFALPGSFESCDVETAWLWEAGCRGMEEKDGVIFAYFDAPRELPLAGEWHDLDEVDWLAAYYEGLKPLRVGALIVAPTHCAVAPGPGDTLLLLDPGMAFGTGHHVTTRLALETLGALGLAGKRVLDVGAGSGILAIAADLLGAAEARGIDIDAATVPIAQANAALNRSTARFVTGVLSEETGESAEVIVANLFAELHAELAADYRRVLQPGGVLAVTGIVAARLPLVLEAFAGFADVAHRLEDGWALVTARG